MLNVRSALQSHGANTHRTLLYRCEVRATLRVTLSSRIPAHAQTKLGDAQAIMVRNRELPRDHVVSNLWGRGVKADARQRELEAGGRHWNEGNWRDELNIFSVVRLFDVRV